MQTQISDQKEQHQFLLNETLGRVSKSEIKKQEMQLRRQKVLEKLRQGKTIVEISEEIKTPISTIRHDADFLIKDGLITKEEIVSKNDKNLSQMAEKIAEIKELIEKGDMSNSDIARQVGVSKDTVSRVRSGNYETNKIEQRSRPKKKKVNFHPNPEAVNHLTEREIAVYDELIKGYQYAYIESKLNISHEELMKSVNILSIVGALSKQGIRDAREKRKIEDKKIVLSLLKQGYTQVDMVRKIEHFNGRAVYKLVKELITDGLITAEEIEEAQKREYRQYMDIVLGAMKKGLTIKETVDLDETGYLTVDSVIYMRGKLLKSGEIGANVLRRNNAKIKKRQSKKKKADYDEEYIKWLKAGLTFDEIARLRNMEFRSVRKRWYILKKERNFTDEQLEDWRNKRRERFTNGQRYLDIYMAGLNDNLVSSVKKFFDICIEEKSFGRDFSKEEFEKLGRAILMDSVFVSKENLEFVMMGYVEKFDYQKCILYFKRLLDFFRGTVYEELISTFINIYNKRRMERIKNRNASESTTEEEFCQ